MAVVRAVFRGLAGSWSAARSKAGRSEVRLSVALPSCAAVIVMILVSEGGCSWRSRGKGMREVEAAARTALARALAVMMVLLLWL